MAAFAVAQCGSGTAQQLLFDGRDWREDDRDRQDFANAQAADGKGFSSAFAGCLVLANTLLGGSGMLGIPQAFSASGYVLGSVFLCVSGWFSAFGCHLLQCSAVRLAQVPSGFGVCSRLVLPAAAKWIPDMAVAIKCFGVACSYLIIVGDLLPPAAAFFGARGELQERNFIVTVAFCFAGALACLRDLTALKHTSLLAVMIVIWTGTLIALFYAGLFDPCTSTALEIAGVEKAVNTTRSTTSAYVTAVDDGWILFKESSLARMGRLLSVPHNDVSELPCNGAAFVEVGASLRSMLKKLPVFIFGFTCHQNIFTVCNEVRHVTRRRMNAIIGGAYLCAGAAFYVAALIGYRTFGDALASDVLKSYPDSSHVAQATRILFSFVAICSYPLQIHPCRNSVIVLLRMLCGRDGQPPSQTGCAQAARYWCLTLLLLAGSYIVALTLDSLGVVLSIVGATGSTAVTFILPGLIYWNVYPMPHLKRKLAGLQFLLGCVIMPTCLAVIFI